MEGVLVSQEITSVSQTYQSVSVNHEHILNCRSFPSNTASVLHTCGGKDIKGVNRTLESIVS